MQFKKTANIYRNEKNDAQNVLLILSRKNFWADAAKNSKVAKSFCCYNDVITVRTRTKIRHQIFKILTDFFTLRTECLPAGSPQCVRRTRRELLKLM